MKGRKRKQFDELYASMYRDFWVLVDDDKLMRKLQLGQSWNIYEHTLLENVILYYKFKILHNAPNFSFYHEIIQDLEDYFINFLSHCQQYKHIDEIRQFIFKDIDKMVKI